MKTKQIMPFYMPILGFLLSIAACDRPISLPTCTPILIDTSTVVGNYWLAEPMISGQCLHVPISHGGGCAKHTYRLKWNGALAESMPPQAFLVLEHIDPGDPCDAIISKNLFFDLEPLLNEPYNQIVVHLSGWQEPLLLED